VPQLSSNPVALHVPDFDLDPSGTVFLNAVMIYGAAALVLYNVGMKNRYQDWFLAAAGLSPITVIALTSWSASYMDVMKDFLPISITAFL
jgi:hypothetical protein